MIDLRSDTVTLPSKEMLECILTAPMGDSGRLDSDGRGGDPTVSALEDRACELTGKERSILLPSGTMGNHVAILTYCQPGDVVLMDKGQHIYNVEKAVCDSRFGQIRPTFYHLKEDGYPDTEEIAKILETEKPKLLCIENTHNAAGGTYIPMPVLKELRRIANRAGVPIHMDGARLFNAATAMNCSAKEICKYVDSVMFCISKGLGAPIGSMLCGKKDYILEAAKTRKLLGGSMRQAGVFAACGLYALEHNVPNLVEDHRRTKIAWEALKGLEKIHVLKNVQSNILMLDISDLGLNADEVIDRAMEKGLWLSRSSDDRVRMVFHTGITDEQVIQAVNIIKEIDDNIKIVDV